MLVIVLFFFFPSSYWARGMWNAVGLTGCTKWRTEPPGRRAIFAYSIGTVFVCVFAHVGLYEKCWLRLDSNLGDVCRIFFSNFSQIVPNTANTHRNLKCIIISPLTPRSPPIRVWVNRAEILQRSCLRLHLCFDASGTPNPSRVRQKVLHWKMDKENMKLWFALVYLMLFLFLFLFFSISAGFITI